MIDSLYDADDRIIPFVPYAPPKRFEHGKWHLVATLPCCPDDDGYGVEVFEYRVPARFYALKTMEPSVNSVGVEKPPICLSTGSGEAELIGMIAKA
jgi:hypothetical protein